jgi:uncharacterized DUF497 family protein
MKLIFEWDNSKAQANLKSHKVGFEEAKTVFNDPFVVTYLDEGHSDDENRFISIGISFKSRVLLVVHTEREEQIDTIVIRIISCRKATPLERRIYEER